MEHHQKLSVAESIELMEVDNILTEFTHKWSFDLECHERSTIKVLIAFAQKYDTMIMLMNNLRNWGVYVWGSYAIMQTKEIVIWKNKLI